MGPGLATHAYNPILVRLRLNSNYTLKASPTHLKKENKITFLASEPHHKDIENQLRVSCLPGHCGTRL